MADGFVADGFVAAGAGVERGDGVGAAGLTVGVAGVGADWIDGRPSGVGWAGSAAGGDSAGGRVRVGAGPTGPGVMVGISGTGQVGVADGRWVALGDGGTSAVGVASGGASEVRNSTATQPSRPSPSRTWRQRRPPASSSSPVVVSSAPSGSVATASPPGVRRRVNPWPPVPVTETIGRPGGFSAGRGVAIEVGGCRTSVGVGAGVGSSVAMTTGAAVGGRGVGVPVRDAAAQAVNPRASTATAARRIRDWWLTSQRW